MNQTTPFSEDRQNESLVDIRSIAVKKDLPKADRIVEFVRQIKNPYRFCCGEFTVNVSFANNGVSLEECLQGIIR